jgi:phosphoribosylanthranilate isomerase
MAPLSRLRREAAGRATSPGQDEPVLVQIYGVTTAGDADLVNGLGPDHVGVVLDEGFGTWDGVDAPTARAIVANLSSVKVVALTHATDRSRIRRTVETVGPHVVHLVRATDGLSPEDVAGLARELAPLEVMVTVPVLGREAVDVARRFAPCADYLLLDTVDSRSGVVGATGRVHDWTVSSAVVAAVDVPVVLAGGLGPENVAQAIDRVRPAGVDSETRTSRSDDRRRKDPEKVRRFVEMARAQ